MDNAAAINEKKGGISSFALKIIAITAMVCDHASVVFIPGEYTILRTIGRIGFPIFAFMIAEGASKTRSIPKYMARLAVFGIISEIPFDLVLLSEGEKIFDMSGVNVYLTLLLGLFSIYCIKNLKGKLAILTPFALVFSLGAAWFTATDYGPTGVAAIIVFYLASQCRSGAAKKLLTVIAVCLPLLYVSCYPEIREYNLWSSPLNEILIFNYLEVPALASLIFIFAYNGKRGKKMNKYFFYAFYPAHIVLLYVIKLLISYLR